MRGTVKCCHEHVRESFCTSCHDERRASFWANGLAPLHCSLLSALTHSFSSRDPSPALPQIRDYDNQKAALTELEAEVSKVRTVITELESEFTILKAERDQAQGIIKEIMKKIEACSEDLKGLEKEQNDAVNAKNDVLASLDKARNEMNDSMVDYRDNRSFSLKVRDMVTAGQVEEARALCKAQVDEYTAKLASDSTFCKEYHSLWAQQRRYPISDLLPSSSTTAREPKADAGGKGAAGGKGGKGAKGAAAPPPKPQGAEKAKLLIEQLMAQAQAEASRITSGRRAVDDAAEESAESEPDEPAAPEPVAVPEPVKAKPSVSARPADVLKAVELPKIEDVEFVPPVIARSAPAGAASSPEEKEKLREEQRRKAQEAEERKRKAAELKDKKRKEAEARRVEDEERRRVEAAEAAARAKQQAAAKAAAEAEARRKAEALAAQRKAELAAVGNPAAKVIAQSQKVSAAKAKPKSASKDPLSYLALLKKRDVQIYIVLAVIALIILVLSIMAARS